MKKYMVIYHAPVDNETQIAEASPEDMDKSMEAWIVWASSSAMG